MPYYEFMYVQDYGIREIKEYQHTCLTIGFVEPLFITYLLDTNTLPDAIQEPVELLLLSTTNPAHSICEFISFYTYYTSQLLTRKIVINTLITTKMPYLWQLITLFFPHDRFIFIEQGITYSFTSLHTRRNHHFLATSNWDTIPFTLNDNVLKFEDLQTISYFLSCDFLFSKIKEIYEANRHRYTLNDSIMIIKTTTDKLTVTPHRAIEYPDNDVLDALNAHSIKMVAVTDFADIYEYICTIYHAKKLIFSYGGPMCINRFFCNPEASIVVLANLHYKHEYEYNNQNKNFWHVRHAMLSPVRSQTFLLDVPNELTVETVELIRKSLV